MDKTKKSESKKVSKIRSTLDKMNRNKAAIPDRIVTETLSILDAFSIDMITEIIKRNIQH